MCTSLFAVSFEHESHSDFFPHTRSLGRDSAMAIHMAICIHMQGKWNTGREGKLPADRLSAQGQEVVGRKIRGSIQWTLKEPTKAVSSSL